MEPLTGGREPEMVGAWEAHIERRQAIKRRNRRRNVLQKASRRRNRHI